MPIKMMLRAAFRTLLCLWFFWRKSCLDFYGEVIRGRRLRAEWLMGDISDIERNAIINCMIAFGDILVNPSCVDNYDSAPLVIHDIFLLAEFTALMSNQITQEFVNLFKETYNA